MQKEKSCIAKSTLKNVVLVMVQLVLANALAGCAVELQKLELQAGLHESAIECKGNLNETH